MSTVGNGVTIYLMAREDVERMLVAKYGKKLMVVNHKILARQNEKRASWLQNIRDGTRGKAEVPDR